MGIINMKFSLIALIGAVAANAADPIPTAADTPSSGYFGADEDDVMNNIFNHYAVEVTNAAGQKTGKKVLYKDGCQKACAEIMLVTKQWRDRHHGVAHLHARPPRPPEPVRPRPWFPDRHRR